MNKDKIIKNVEAKKFSNPITNYQLGYNDSIDYLKTIQKDMREYELKIAKRGTFKKALKEYQK